MTYEQIMDDDNFFKKVWCNPNNARYVLLLNNGHSDKEIHDMFEMGSMFEKVREYVVKMTPEERFSFYVWNF